MGKVVGTAKAIATRVVFGLHGAVAIWQVVAFRGNPLYWYLGTPVLILLFEALYTLVIHEAQEWKWFCPSVFLYLLSVVPAIWLLELDKVDRRLRHAPSTWSAPVPWVAPDTWVTLVEQFLMLILIVGRWMLPKGELTRDQLSQLLLVYIGTAADIIEFFDSFKDDTVAQRPALVLLTLAIWSWSLLQFTVVLTATRSRKSRLSAPPSVVASRRRRSCCSIDVWGIALNITLQDLPFLVFRLLLIVHYRIISYMNVFFTCKNALVLLLQLYRLHVLRSESRKPQPQPPASAARRRMRVTTVEAQVQESRRRGGQGRLQDTGYDTASSSRASSGRRGDQPSLIPVRVQGRTSTPSTPSRWEPPRPSRSHGPRRPQPLPRGRARDVEATPSCSDSASPSDVDLV